MFGLMNPWVALALAFALTASHGFAYYKGHSSASEKAEIAMNAYKAEIVAAQQARAKENADKIQKVNEQLEAVKVAHAEQVNQIWRQADELKITNRASDRTIADLRKRLRDSTETYATVGLSGFSEATGEPTESRGNSDTTTAEQVRALRLACELTTMDYNALAEAWAKGCEIHGCE
jgi:hypothetical protein